MADSATRTITGPNIENVALVIVSFHPDEHFGSRVESIAEQFTQIFIIDNSGPEAPVVPDLEINNTQLVRNQVNLGLAKALNIGCTQALEQGFEWAVTLDQDTELSPDYLRKIISSWLSSGLSPHVLGCNYFNVTRARNRFALSGIPHTKIKKTVITSGCLMHLPTWSELGKFRAEYFIDSIDHEFCLRARKRGHRVAINLQPLMTHTIGDNEEYPEYLKRFAPYSHSSLRTYTNARNTTRTILEYAYEEPAWCIRKMAGLVYEAVAIILLEKQKVARIKAFFTGLRDGYLNKMGRP